jgi:hypothetical protein
MLGIGNPPAWPGWLAPPEVPPPDVPGLELELEAELALEPEPEPEPPVLVDAFAGRELWLPERDAELDGALPVAPPAVLDDPPPDVPESPCESLPEPSPAAATPLGEGP